MLPRALSGEPASQANATSEAEDDGAHGQIDESACAKPGRTLIGNVHALLPGAVAFIRDDKAGIVLDIGFDNTSKPGSTAPDFSYSTWSFKVEDANLTVEWGRVGQEAAVFRVRTDRNVKLLLKIPANPWRPFFHGLNVADGGLDVSAITFDGSYIPWNLRVDPESLRTVNPGNDASVELQIAPNRSARFVAGYSDLPAIDTVDSTIDLARANYSNHRAQARGEWGDFAGAITDNLNNNRLYSSLTKRIGRSGWLVKDVDRGPGVAQRACERKAVRDLVDQGQDQS